MKVIVPKLDGYNKDGQAVFGQRDATEEEQWSIDRRMPLQAPRKPVDAFK